MHYTSREVYEFISRQTGDPIVERKTCAVSGKPFAIYQGDLDFYAKISPAFAGQRFQIPTPTLCPEERTRRRLMHQNMSKLYRRKCDATGETIISNLSPEKQFPVYNNPFWWSDKRDSRDYGRDFNFTRTFTEQFQELWNVVPQPNLGRSFLLDQNSDYTNYAGGNKNCYLIFHADMDEDCMYGVGVKKCKDCVDILHTHMSEHMYQTINCRKCYNVLYAENCEECRNCEYIINCFGCEYCFRCSNLFQKRYCIFNKQYTKEEYEQYMNDNKNTQVPVVNILPATYGYQNNKAYGCNIYYSQDAKFCSDVQESKNIAYSDRVYNGPNEDVYDINEYGMQINKVYECVAVGINSSNIMSGIFVNEEVDRIYYSLHAHRSKNCFGCIGVVGGEYRIFNKQYTKEEYETTVAKIISHMQSTGERGEFFHPSLSPFGYNETVANEYFPVSRTGALAKGYTWLDHNYDPVIPEGANVIDWKTTIDDPTQDEHILKAIFVCESSGRPYRIIKQELEFYRKHNLPLPRKHPDIRHEERMKLRPGRTLYLRNCDKTGEEMLSVYPPDYPGKVYSEKAYQEEVFG